MGYSKEAYAKIKAEYSKKYSKARELADSHRFELHAKIPRVCQIDSLLAGTGMQIMRIVAGKNDVDAKIAALRERNDALIAERDALLVANGYPKDYSDVKYECDKCDDSGYVDGKMCECMKKALVLAGYESSGLGALIKTQSFNNFSLDYYKHEKSSHEKMKNVASVLYRFAEGFDGNTYRNFLLFGGTGLGKTHLSTSVAKVVIDKGFDVLYVSAISMLSDFEYKRFGDVSAKSTDRYYEADLLIIDDLGTEVVNQFTVSCLYDVINSRINSRKCTFINTNFTPKEMETKYSERITSRLFGEYTLLQFSGHDIRMQKITK